MDKHVQFQQAEPGLLNDIYNEKFQAYKGITEALEQLKTVPETALTHQVETIIMKSGGSCDIVFAGKPIKTGQVVMLMSRSFPFTELINFW